jgi:hypothetical protein
MNESDRAHVALRYVAAAEAALHSPVVAGAFFVERSDDRAFGAAEMRGLYGLYWDVRNVLVHLARRRRLGRLPHWKFVAVTDHTVAILDIRNDPAPSARVIRSVDRAGLVATAASNAFDVDLELPDGTLPLSAVELSEAARQVVDLLVASS